MNFKRTVIFPIIFFLLQGCSAVNNNTSDSALGELVIAEPLAVNYKSEIALARLTEVIQRAEINDEQRAQFHYDRGVLFDSVGLRSLARLDFNKALKLKPDLTDAYNFLGIHYTQLQEFNQAYEAFDSAIDLAPNHQYAYLNRGIALYYGGRPKLARDDFNTFHQLQEDDPYRLLWLYLAEIKIDVVEAKNNLKSRATSIDESTWAKQIIYLYLGDISQKQFIGELTTNVKSNRELSDRLCEAYFYLAKYNQIKQKKSVAVNFFKLALSTNVFEFVEHRYAKLELDIMRSELIDKTQ